MCTEIIDYVVIYSNLQIKKGSNVYSIPESERELHTTSEGERERRKNKEIERYPKSENERNTHITSESEREREKNRE